MSDHHEATFFWPYVGPHSVAVKGSFDNWKQPIPLTRTAHGFEARVPVEWGQSVQYKYIVDGTWVTAEDKPTEPDTRGNVNNVYHAPVAPAKVEEIRVVTTSDLPPVHPEVVPAPPADAISPSLDPLPEKPAVDPKPTTLELVKDTVIASEGTGASPISYVASGMGAAIQAVTGVDPISPPQLPVDDAHTHSPIRFNRKGEDLLPVLGSPVKEAITPAALVDAVKKPVVAVVPDTLEGLKALTSAPIVEAITKPIVAVMPAPMTDSPAVDAAPFVFEEAKKEVEAVPAVLKETQDKAAAEAAIVPEVPYVPEIPDEPQVLEVPKPVDVPVKEPEVVEPAIEPPKVLEVPKPIEELPKVLEVPKLVEEPPKVPELPKPVEEPPKVPDAPKVDAYAAKEPEAKVVDPPVPTTPKRPSAPIDLPATLAAFPTVPSPKKPEPATPTKSSIRNSDTNGTLTSVKSRESTKKRMSFLGRQSSEISTSPSKGSVKERKRKTSFLGKLKHVFTGHSDKDKHPIKEEK